MNKSISRRHFIRSSMSFPLAAAVPNISIASELNLHGLEGKVVSQKASYLSRERGNFDKLHFCKNLNKPIPAYGYNVIKLRQYQKGTSKFIERFEVHSGDQYNDFDVRAGSERLELCGNGAKLGDEVWIGWSIFTPIGFKPMNVSTLSGSFHQGSLGAPMMFHYMGGSPNVSRYQLTIQAKGQKRKRYKLIPYTEMEGKWTHLACNVKFGTNGFMKMWVNGQLKADFVGMTAYPDDRSINHHYGIYRPNVQKEHGNVKPQVLYFKDQKMVDSPSKLAQML